MKILIICSKSFYSKIEPIKKQLEEKGHQIELPNYYDNPLIEKQNWDLGENEHAQFKTRMYKRSKEVINNMDAVLALNFDKNGNENYIGGATFLELYEASMGNKKIYLYNDIPQGMLYDEIHGFSPIVINGNLDLIK